MLLFASMKSIKLKLSIINYTLLFVSVIQSSYFLLFSEVSNYSLLFLLSISNPVQFMWASLIIDKLDIRTE